MTDIREGITLKMSRKSSEIERRGTTMRAIVLPDEDLKRLEKRFGSGVRQMGWWNSDGVFGYSSVPIAAVEKAAGALDDPTVTKVLSRLKETPERTKPFVELLESFGPSLIEKIAAAYQEFAVELLVSHRGTS